MEILDIIDKALGQFERLGINPLYVAAVIFLTWVAKAFDRRNRLKQGYVLFPLVAGMLVCGTVQPFEWRAWLVASLVHAGVGAWAYSVWSTFWKNRQRKGA